MSKSKATKEEIEAFRSHLHRNLAHAYSTAASVAALSEGHQCEEDAKAVFDGIAELLKRVISIKADEEE